MQIFENRNGCLKKLNLQTFKKEGDLQNLVEENLGTIFPGLEKVAAQFSVAHYKLDTLAYDHQDNTFVIIEYKPTKNAKIGDQINAYKNKLNEYIDRCVTTLVDKKPQIKQQDIDRSTLKVIVVKPGFPQQQIDAWASADWVYLCDARKFSGGLIVNWIGKEPNYTRRQLGKTEPTRHSEADWLAGEYGGNPLPKTRDLYFELKNAILNKFPKIKHAQTQRYAGFRLNSGKVCEVKCSKRHLTLRYNTDRPDSLEENDFVKTRPIAGHGHHRSQIRQKSDIDKALEYLDMLYHQSAGHPLGLKDAGDENNRPHEASNQNVSQIAHKVIIDKLRDGKEHTLQELYSRMFKTLEDGMSVPEQKAREAMRSKLRRLKKAGKIAHVGHAAYKRA